MGTLTALMDVSSHALAADQTALSVTAQNIANQNTAGYSRRVVNWAESDTVQVRGLSVGMGASASVSSTRDSVLAKSLQQQTDVASASSARLSATNSLQGLFALNTSGTDAAGIESTISGFFGSLSTLGASPSDATGAQAVYTAAQNLTSSFQEVSGQIATQRSALDTQVGAAVTQVNQLLGQIASLNGQIATAPAGTDTSSYLDQRDNLIFQLSGLMDVSQAASSNGTVTLTTSDGTLLVGGSTAEPLGTTVVGGVTHLFAASGSGGADITGSIHGGSIGGNLSVRDGDIPSVTAQLNTIAAAIADAVNTQNSAGFTNSGAAGGPLFSYSSGAGAATSLAVVAAGPSAIASAGAGEGPNGGSNATAMAALASSTPIAGQSFATAFAGMLTSLGLSAAQAQSKSMDDAAVLAQLSSQRDMLSGVSLDEEAANLTQYQRAYQAAAKVLSIVDTLMASALNLGTETTVT